jgi:hypothetical protein
VREAGLKKLSADCRWDRLEELPSSWTFHRLYLRQVVSIHQAMFQKLLFEEDSAIGLDLAELFQDVGKAYLQISDRISENRSHHSLQD